jgi:signal peptidase I
MEPGIKNNQLLFLDPLAYKRRAPRRGDIVAFKARQKDRPKFYIKRVIGLPGEKISIYGRKVHINNEILEEDYLNETMKYGRRSDTEIRQGYIYVMGDNRNHSHDSRDFGPINIKKDVIGLIRQRK